MNTSIKSLIDRGCDAADRGDHAEAIRLFTRAVGHGESWVALNLGNSYVAIGDMVQAIEAYELGWKSGDADSGISLAQLLEDEGHFGRAIEIYRELLDRGDERARVNLAWHLHRDGLTAEASKMLRSAMAGVGEPADAAAGMLGHWEWESGNVIAAEPLLRRGANSYPAARVDLAELLSSRGNGKGAEQMLSEGVQAGEIDSMIPFASILHERGDLDRAEGVLRAASALGDGHAAYNLALMLASIGRDDDAAGLPTESAR
jgi:tetratricopeptide (TPR) repeat protein